MVAALCAEMLTGLKPLSMTDKEAVLAHWKMRSLNARMRRIVRGMTGYFSAAQGAGMTLLC